MGQFSYVTGIAVPKYKFLQDPMFGIEVPNSLRLYRCVEQLIEQNWTMKQDYDEDINSEEFIAPNITIDGSELGIGQIQKLVEWQRVDLQD